MHAVLMIRASEIASRVCMASVGVVGTDKSAVIRSSSVTQAILNVGKDCAWIKWRRPTAVKSASGVVMAACVLIMRFATRNKTSAGRVVKTTKSVVLVTSALIID